MVEVKNDAHTPGPWEWHTGIMPPDGPDRYADIYVLDVDREPIILAQFNDSIPGGRANARPIAAAPDLLEALYRLKTEAEADGLDKKTGWDCWVSLANAAILKASPNLPSASQESGE